MQNGSVCAIAEKKRKLMDVGLKEEQQRVVDVCGHKFHAKMRVKNSLNTVFAVLLYITFGKGLIGDVSTKIINLTTSTAVEESLFARNGVKTFKAFTIGQWKTGTKRALLLTESITTGIIALKIADGQRRPNRAKTGATTAF